MQIKGRVSEGKAKEELENELALFRRVNSNSIRDVALCVGGKTSVRVWPSVSIRLQLKGQMGAPLDRAGRWSMSWIIVPRARLQQARGAISSRLSPEDRRAQGSKKVARFGPTRDHQQRG